MPNPPERLTARIERTRNWIVEMFALGITTSAIAFVLLAGAVVGWQSTDAAFLRMVLLQAGISLVAAALAWRGLRRWGARLLAVSLLIVPTMLVLGFDMPYEPALAAYVAVILITAAAIGQVETVVVTLVAAPLSLVAYAAAAPGPLATVAMVSIVGLLVGTGITLAMLGEGLLRAVRQLEASEAHFQRLAHLDPLTGLGNRREFDQQLTGRLALCSASQPLALVVMDVDNLKTLNDRHGHANGDRALQAVAEAIRLSTRETDVPTRIGGDEFAIILSGGGALGARRVAERIRENLAQTSSAVDMIVTLSIGLSEASHPEITPEGLLAEADAALYAGRAHVRKPVEAA